MNTIKGVRIEDKLYLSVDGKVIDPKYSQKIKNHSPDGFSAGYGGSGPAQSALAILLAVVDRETALDFYQDFKWDFLANPEYLENDFEFDVDIKAWLKTIKH